jgi:curved DNA-binding protein
MSIHYKDYYQVLGVARTATADEIRKSFRKLARQYHPDVAKNKTDAESKFKEINEAYEVLGDPEKRKKYDELGPNWKQGAEFRPPPGWGQGQGGGFRSYSKGRPAEDSDFQFGGTGFSDFFDQLFGARGGAASRGRFQQDGEEAEEKGQDVESDILVSLHEVMHGSVRPITLQRQAVCPKCHGVTSVNGRICPACHGEGRTVKKENYQVKIPTGVRDGQRLRLAGRGEPGTGRAAAGDLYLRVRFEKHPDFRVEDADLFYELDIAPWEAVLGAQVPVPTLEGSVNIRIPTGAQGGQRMRVRGKGLPKPGNERGDLYILLRVQVPASISDQERKLWEELASKSEFRPRTG